MSFWRSDERAYSGLAKLLHWLSALTVVGLFFLGLWMVELTYYDEWYRKGPDLHRSIGLSLALVTLLRILYRLTVSYPGPLASHPPLVVWGARVVHLMLYGLLLVLFVSGYLITTAKGDPIGFFGLFEIPSLISGIPNLEDRAGEVHEIAAFTLMGLAVLHALAALKHHVLDRDDTLRRMITRGKS
jgi:cytochrome b561